MKTLGWIFIILCVLIGSILFGICSRATDDAIKTAEKEFKVSALLKKYEYFKDCSAQLDKKLADLQVYEERLKDLQSQYSGVARKDWARDDREQYSIWQSEQSGIKASYNSLAAEYNSAMSKFNYAFCNKGDLPRGADTPLPREYREYIYK